MIDGRRNSREMEAAGVMTSAERSAENRARAEENRENNLRRIEEVTGRTEDDINSQLDHAVAHGVAGSRGEDSAVNEAGQHSGFVEGAPPAPTPTPTPVEPAPAPAPRAATETEAETQPAPELDAEQEEVLDELGPTIQGAADNSVVGNTDRRLNQAERDEADRRDALLQDAVRRVLGLTGHRGRDAIRKIAHAIEAFASGWNGNPSRITEDIMEEYRAFRDDDLDRGRMTLGAQLTLEQAMQDQGFRREMAELEQDFTMRMADFDDMRDRERMMLADQLNREMARLERMLGDDALRTGLAIQLQNDKTFMEFVMDNP